MMRLLVAFLLALASPALAQTPAPRRSRATPRARWSACGSCPTRIATGAARSPSSSMPPRPGRSVTQGATCAAAFPDLRVAAAWTMGSDDALKLIDAKGVVLLELTEVESGMYETTPRFTHYFLQTLAATGQERITDDLFGEWQITRGPGRAICALTLGNTAHDADSFVLTLKPGCDQTITRFKPVSWKLDRGQFVVLAANGQAGASRRTRRTSGAASRPRARRC